MIERVLVINFGGLGDMVYTTPIFRELKRNLPDCYLIFLTEPPYAEVFINNPYINELILFNKKDYRLRDALKFYRRLKRKNLDLVIDLTKGARGAFITWMTGAEKRVGFKHKGRELFAYNVWVTRDNSKTICPNSKYVVEFFLDTLRALGMKVEDLSLRLYPGKKDWSVVRDFLINKKIDWTKPIIGLNPNVTINLREWQPEGFAEVGDRLVEKYGANIILIQAPNQEKMVSSIIKKMHTSPFIASGFTIKQLTLLISKFSLLITVDTGIKPLAVAMDVPTITLFGPTNYINYTPTSGKHLVVRKDLPCSPCGKLHCNNPQCMTLITPEDVLSKVEEILASGVNYKNS
ncbi:MAG: glycosyltransferase family 9 protein [bacterium]